MACSRTARSSVSAAPSSVNFIRGGPLVEPLSRPAAFGAAPVGRRGGGRTKSGMTASAAATGLAARADSSRLAAKASPDDLFQPQPAARDGRSPRRRARTCPASRWRCRRSPGAAPPPATISAHSSAHQKVRTRCQSRAIPARCRAARCASRSLRMTAMIDGQPEQEGASTLAAPKAPSAAERVQRRRCARCSPARASRVAAVRRSCDAIMPSRRRG